MVEIDAKTVMALRKQTGAPMMDCKAALKETGGNIEEAITVLRKKGLKTADSKAGREASEGYVFTEVTDDRKAAVLLGVACETDFVAKNEEFQAFGKKLCEIAFELPAAVTLEDLLKAPYEGSEDVETQRKALVAKIGENIQITQLVKVVPQGSGIVYAYLHHNGKLAVTAEIEVPADKAGTEEFETFAKDLCLVIAAMRPQYLDASAVPSEFLDKERAIVAEQTRENMKGRPDEIVEKAVEGRLQKLVSELTLVDQPWIRDNAKTVDGIRKDVGSDIKIVGFQRLELGA